MFLIICLLPTLLLVVGGGTVIALRIKAARHAQWVKKTQIEGHAIPQNEVPLEHFKTYTTLPAGCSFTTYYTRPGYEVTTYTINSHGMRDEEFPRRKPKGEYRIAVLGDSFTEGYRMERDGVYCAVLERLLSAGTLPPGTKRIRTMNFGMRGEYPEKYIARLRDQALQMDPDMVIVQTFDNDAWDKYRDTDEVKATGRRRLDFLYEMSPFWEKAITETVKDLESVRRICGDHKLPLIVVHIQAQEDFPEEGGGYVDERYEKKGIKMRRNPRGFVQDPLEDQERAWAAQAGVAFVSAHDLFKAHKAKTPEFLYLHSDGHLNARGHELLAQELARAVRELWRQH